MESNLKSSFWQTYLSIKNPKPDFRINTLKDYYKIRKDLSFYQYSNEVMLDLIRLNLECFDIPKRIDRYTLFRHTMNFIVKYDKANYGGWMSGKLKIIAVPTQEVVDGFFQVFQRVSTDYYPVLFDNENEKQSSGPFWYLIKLLVSVNLSEPQLQWICDQAFTNPQVRPLLETTIVPQKKIADFVEQHFNVDFVVAQRTRYTSHLIDWKPDFELTQAQILTDCDQLNVMDQVYIDNIIDNYYQEELIRSIEFEIDPEGYKQYNEYSSEIKLALDPVDEYLKTLNTPDVPYTLNDCHSFSEKYRGFSKSEFFGFDRDYCFLPHTFRLYPIPTKTEKRGQVFFPDFDEGRRLLEQNIELVRCKYMVWAIAESRLPKSQKAKLMKKYWHPELANTWLRIAKLKGISEMLTVAFEND